MIHQWHEQDDGTRQKSGHTQNEVLAPARAALERVPPPVHERKRARDERARAGRLQPPSPDRLRRELEKVRLNLDKPDGGLQRLPPQQAELRLPLEIEDS